MNIEPERSHYQPDTPVRDTKPKAGDGTPYGDWLAWLEATWKIKNAKKAKKAQKKKV